MRVVLQNLTKTFPGRGKRADADVVAVRDFSFELPDGKLVTLLGPSGCGKSTALNLISGLLSPTSGAIIFGDEDVTELSPESRGVGLVFQNYALYPHLSVLQNILFPLQNLRGDDKLSKPAMLSAAREAAELVQVGDLLERRPSELSGGQQQRVAIARAIVKKPRILLLDEPLSNLDARLRLQMREELRRIQQEIKITTVFVTHDQEDAMSISDLIVVMRNGEIEQIGRPQEVYDNPAKLFVAQFLGSPQINTFSGRVSGNTLYIGEDAVLNITGAADRDVIVGVRPEGMTPGERGALRCVPLRVEVMGRDISVVCSNAAAAGPTLRAVINADSGLDQLALPDTLGFTLNPQKVHLFDRDTGERVRFESVGGRAYG
ncbi:MAG: ABC transporter ATP-binding protein [Oscillospiraceae bacterium]|jgi:multiple sugar transport system ATP-binding protein|nr:ABC transporter ATP-binding protein [Oscillospiraceae bacterium]